jgi:hypothetical protein
LWRGGVIPELWIAIHLRASSDTFDPTSCNAAERNEDQSLEERDDPVTEKPTPAEVGTLAEALADFIGVLDSSEIVPGGAQLSERTGERFAEILLEKRKQGRL